MMNCQCQCKCKCTLWAIIAAVVVGVIAAFLQITGMITVTPAFLWVLLGIAVVYLAVLVVASALSRGENGCACACSALNALLVGILGTALFSVVLLALGVVATSVLSAALVGLLLASFALTLAGSACYVKALTGCGC
ncbi:MAG: hypothetical protein IIX91_03800 [Clostridia bacterium]|nr:hypothetical protein [Clostridia bacterium]